MAKEKDWTEWPLPGPPGTRYTRKEVATWRDVDVKTLDRMIDAGLFPRGIKDSPQSEPTWSGLDLACWLHLRGRWHPTLEDGPAEEEEDNEGQPRSTKVSQRQRKSSDE